MICVEKREYHSVPASESLGYDYVVPDGKILYLETLGANSASGTNTSVQVIWDPDGENDILMVDYNSIVQQTSVQLLGDGVKVLRILLINNNANADETMGGYFLGSLGG